MASQNINFDLDQGADFRFDVEVRDIGDNPIDITESVIIGQIRRTVSSREVEAIFSIEPTDLASGKFAVYLSAEDTSKLRCEPSFTAQRVITQFAYDVEIHYFNKRVTRILHGVLSVSPEVTR